MSYVIVFFPHSKPNLEGLSERDGRILVWNDAARKWDTDARRGTRYDMQTLAGRKIEWLRKVWPRGNGPFDVELRKTRDGSDNRTTPFAKGADNHPGGRD